MAKIVHQRINLLKQCVPELWSNPGTVLYIGARVGRFFASQSLWKAGNKITVLEIWQPFIDGLEQSRFKRRYTHIIQGDVTKTELDSYDYVLWFHGPEHIHRIDFEPTLAKLEKAVNRAIVITCPFGIFRQGVYFDNPHTEHKSHYMPSDFEALGYQVATIGRPNQKVSQLQAWKR